MRLRRSPIALVALALAAGVLSAVPSSAAVVEEVYYVPSVDGALIRVEVERDSAKTNLPVVLTYSPYHSLNDAVVFGDGYASLSSQGYARARADVLGTRGSDGCWDYGGLKEQQSGVDVVKFLAGKTKDANGNTATWSSGAVAMIGASYDGTTASMVAARGDDVPELKAIVPIVGISRWYGYAYSQGMRYTLQSPNADPSEQGLDTPLLFDGGFAKTVAPDPSAPNAAAVAQDRAAECGAVEHTVQGYDESPDYTRFWQERDYLKDAAKIRAAVLIGGGWQDYNVKQEESTNLYNALPVDDPATPDVEGAPFKMLVMGQNKHGSPTGTNPAWGQLVTDFLAWRLKGAPKSARLEAAAYTVGRTGNAGAYGTTPSKKEAAWPPVGTTDVTLHLGGGAGSGTLSAAAPAPGTAALVDSGAGDEYRALRDVTRETDWLLYESPALKSDTRIAGEAVLRSVLSSTRDRGSLTPVLVDLEPGMQSLSAARGFLNLQYRDGLAVAKPVPVGTPVTAPVVMKPQDYTFKAGHRIGVLLLGSNVAWARSEGPQQLTVHEGPAGSTLTLPVVNPAGTLF